MRPQPIQHPLPTGVAWLNPAATRTPDDLPAFLSALLDQPQTLRQTFKRDDRSTVTLHQINGQQWVLKCYRLARWKGLVYGPLRMTPAWREWAAAARLHALGRRVNRPALLIADTRLGPGTQALVFPFVEGPSLDQMLTDDGSKPAAWTAAHARRRRQLAASIGRQIGLLSAGGHVNRDHKPSNLILDHDCLAQGLEPMIIDPVGLRRRRSDGKVYHMFAVMLRAALRVGTVTPREQLLCLRAALEADPSLDRHAHDRLLAAIRRLRSMGDSRPLSYDPDAWPPASHETRAEAPPHKTAD